MNDHLRDLGREMALELRPPHRLWRPKDLKYLESMGFKTILGKTHVRCFHSIFDESMNSQVTFFLGQPDICVETSSSLLWLELRGNSTEQPCIPSWISLQNVQCLKIKGERLKTLWENRMQAPSQLKELQISETFLEKIPDFLGISDNLENVVLDVQGWPIQGLSLLESLSMNLCSLCLRSSTLIGERASTKTEGRTTCESLVIRNFKFSTEVAWNNGGMSSSVRAPMSGLEKLEISGDKLVFKILISGIHYPSLESIKLHCMENLMEVDLISMKTLNCLDITNCKHLKSLSGISNLAKLVLLNFSQCPELEELSLGHLSCLERITIVDCKHWKSLSGISDLAKLVLLNISQCPELEELSLGHLSCLERITIVDCKHLKSLSRISNLANLVLLNISQCPKLEELNLDHLSCLERITIVDCKHFKSLSGISDLAKLVLLNISQCPKLEELNLGHLSCLERITIVDCKHFKSLSGISDLAKLVLLNISQCSELEELSLGHLSCLERITIVDCKHLKSLSSISNLAKLVLLNISQRPKLEELNLGHLSCLERITIVDCKHFKSVSASQDLGSLVKLNVYDSVSGVYRFRMLAQLNISECPELQELRLAHLSYLQKIVIENCNHLKSVSGINNLAKLVELEIFDCGRLEFECLCLSDMKCLERIIFHRNVKVKYFELHGCQNLKTIKYGYGEFEDLSFRDYTKLEKLLDFERLIFLESIIIDGCGEFKYLQLDDCQNLKSVSGKLKIIDLYINKCPELEELPKFSSWNYMENNHIESCGKLQNIMLPKTFIKLSVESCRDLQRVVGTGDLTNLRKLHIKDCPKLEELPSFSRVSWLEQIEIHSSEMLENMAGIEELHVLDCLRLCYCSKAVIRNCIHKLKSE